jgi:hypothetical protein
MDLLQVNKLCCYLFGNGSSYLIPLVAVLYSLMGLFRIAASYIVFSCPFFSVYTPELRLYVCKQIMILQICGTLAFNMYLEFNFLLMQLFSLIYCN